MDSRDFYLITDTSVLCCYLAGKWLEYFGRHPNFRGVVVREDRPTEAFLQARRDFHAEYGGQKMLTDYTRGKLLELYPDLDDTEQAAIGLYGIPQYSTTYDPDTIFLSRNLNSASAKQWLQEICQDASPWFFTCLGQILKAWWMEMSQSHVLNCHSAVLPYARGMYALENLAILQDREAFQTAAGFTIHYIDARVDTGPIIQAERIIDPFRFDSVWSFKGYVYVSSFDAYVKAADRLLKNEETLPAGVIHDPSLRSSNFQSKDFTPDKRRQAEAGYLAMKQQAQ